MSLSGILTALDMNPGGDIAAQQRNICAAIQMLENQKYNETVEVVQKTMPDMRKVLDRIRDIRDLFNTEGALSETVTNATVSDIYMQADFATWEKKVGAYDRQIQALTRMQQMLAQRALKGTPSPWGPSSRPLHSRLRSRTEIEGHSGPVVLNYWVKSWV